MSPWHLLWIVPVSLTLGAMCLALLVINDQEDEDDC